MSAVPRPRLRTILLAVNLLVLVVPVLGIAGLRIYETQLIRRTEAEVIAQAAHLKAAVEVDLAKALEAAGRDGLPDGFGLDRPVQWPEEFYDLRPINPYLDSYREEVREPEAPPQPPQGAVDPLLRSIGADLETRLIRAQKTTLSGMTVVDWRGNVVASTNASQRQMSLANREEIQRALDGEVVHLLRQREVIPEQTSLESLTRETSSRVFFAMPLTHDGRIIGAVTVWRTPMSLPQALYKNRGALSILLALMLLSGLSITGLTAFYIGRPIQRLIAQTDQAARHGGDGTRPIGKPGTYEVQRLSESIAAMATSLEERADYIRTFARSVSHEFKTPLTSIRGTVELLQDHLEQMSDEERDDFLAMLDADAARLEQLVGRLLELAKADVARSDDEHCDARRVVQEIADAHGDDDFVIDVDLPDHPVSVAISDDALRAALTNLVVNAQEHGQAHASIALTTQDDQIILAVHDDGPGISPANAPRIFDEFFTTARDRGGTGLGLSITRALLAAYDATIDHIPTDEGARFEISLRRAHQSDETTAST